MIYELNGTVHWELSPKLMRDLIGIVRAHVNVTPGAKIGDARLIELSNFASALECELYRMSSAKRAALHERDVRVYKAEGFPVHDNLETVQPDNLAGGIEL